MKHRTVRSAAAFTLMEVLVALVLIATVSAAAFSFFWSIGTARERLSQASEQSLSCACLKSLLEEALLSSELGSGSGSFATDALSLTVPCRVVRVPTASGPPPYARILRLRFDSSSNALLAAWDGQPPSVIVKHVASIAFRAYDGRQWSEEFNASSLGRLPAAIELSLSWERPAKAETSAPQSSADPADVLITMRVPDAQPDETEPLTAPTPAPKADAQPHSHGGAS